MIIKALSSDDESFASYGHPIVEAKLFTNIFCFLSFFHIRRQCNSLVHDLIRYVSGLSILIVYNLHWIWVVMGTSNVDCAE